MTFPSAAADALNKQPPRTSAHTKNILSQCDLRLHE
jgi:hypothetical protein